MNEITRKTLENNMIEILMSTWFEFWKLKKWFEWQITVKKFMIKMKKSEKTVEQMIKTQKIIENNAEHETDSEITIIDNIFV